VYGFWRQRDRETNEGTDRQQQCVKAPLAMASGALVNSSRGNVLSNRCHVIRNSTMLKSCSNSQFNNSFEYQLPDRGHDEWDFQR